MSNNRITRSNSYTVPDCYKNQGGGGGTVKPSEGALGNAIEALLNADSDGALWSGPHGGQGNTFCNIYIPTQTVEIREMATYCTQTSQAQGTELKMGIYDLLTGEKLAETVDGILASVGTQFLPLKTPIILERKRLLYRAIAGNENGARFLWQSNKWAGAGSPSISFQVPNAMLPQNISAFTSNKINFRFNVGVL